MKPETEKRMAERLGWYWDDSQPVGDEVRNADDDSPCYQPSDQLLQNLWQLCGKEMERAEDLEERLRFVGYPVAHQPEGE